MNVSSGVTFFPLKRFPWSCHGHVGTKGQGRRSWSTDSRVGSKFVPKPANLQIRRVRRLKFQNLKLTAQFQLKRESSFAFWLSVTDFASHCPDIGRNSCPQRRTLEVDYRCFDCSLYGVGLTMAVQPTFRQMFDCFRRERILVVSTKVLFETPNFLYLHLRRFPTSRFSHYADVKYFFSFPTDHPFTLLLLP